MSGPAVSPLDPADLREPRGSFVVIATKLDHLSSQVMEVRLELRGRLDVLEARVRELEDYRLRVQTLLLPASIALSALVSVLVRIALDAAVKGAGS